MQVWDHFGFVIVFIMGLSAIHDINIGILVFVSASHTYYVNSGIVLTVYQSVSIYWYFINLFQPS